MRIGMASGDWDSDGNPGGCCRYRLVEPGLRLAGAGHEVVLGRSVGQRADGMLTVLGPHGQPLTAEPPEIIIVQRWMNAEAPDLIRGARRVGQVIVNDVDDYFDGLPTSNKAFWNTHPKTDPEHNREHYKASLAASSLVITSTPFLASRLSRYCPRVEVIRNAIDRERYARTRALQGVQRETREDGRLRLLWTGATDWRGGDLEVLQGVLGPWLAANDALIVHMGERVGSPSLAASAGVPGDRILLRPMLDTTLYPSGLRNADIGIAPLARHPFNQAKSACKAMEYLAAGLPVVASDLDEYRALGLKTLCRRAADWKRHLSALRDPQHRAEVYAEQESLLDAHDIEKRWHDWEDVLTGVVSAGA